MTEACQYRERRLINWKTAIRIGAIPAVALLAACSGSGGTASNPNASPGNASVGNSAPGASSSPSIERSAVTLPIASGKCGPHLDILSPTDWSTVARGRDGVRLVAKVCLQSGFTVWAVDAAGGSDPTRGGVAVMDTTGPPEPLTTQSGRIEFDDTPFGDPGDVGEDDILAVVYADSACGNELAETPLDSDGNYTLQNGLPSACETGGSTVDLIHLKTTY